MNVEILTDDVLWRELDGEIIILNLATGCYYGLEGSASDMWRLLVEHGSTERVVEQMASEYDVAPDRLARDVTDLVERLAEKAIVKVTA